MFKTFGIAALAVVVALVVGFGARGATTPTAQAETTDVVVIGCEFIAGAVDGVKTDALTDADVRPPAAAMRPARTPRASARRCRPTAWLWRAPSVANLAKALGDEDGTLRRPTSAAGRMAEFDEDWDNNQISTDCHFGGGRARWTSAWAWPARWTSSSS